jgi:hypothetical protein
MRGRPTSENQRPLHHTKPTPRQILFIGLITSPWARSTTQKFNLSRLELSGAELINEALHPDLKLRFSCFQHNEAGIILEMIAAMLRCGAYQ